MADKLPNIVAVGAGRMGRGIAHVFAFAGYPVTILDLKPRAPEAAAQLAKEARAEIEGNLKFLSSLGVLTEAQIGQVMALIATAGADDAERVLAAADIVFEGVPEVIEAKQDALGRIGRLTRPDTIIASTTSTFLSTMLAEFVDRPARFLNAHFLNPAYLIPLVEVSPAAHTDETHTARLMALLTAAGKAPVRCKASPGYIIPRLQSLFCGEAARMVHEGVATAEDIDRAVTVGFGPRYTTMGPIEFIDWGGVDILYYAGHYLAKALDSPRHAPPPEIDQMMKDGRTGMREGRGYYDFTKMDVAKYQQDKMTRFVQLLRTIDLLPPCRVPAK